MKLNNSRPYTPLVFATGTNIGDKKGNLEKALTELKFYFEFTQASRIYTSPPVDYLDQPDFFNQVVEFKNPNLSPPEVLKILHSIEHKIGREKLIPKGPRIIDIDCLFINDLKYSSEEITIPHPRLFSRSFVVLPLMELPCYDYLKTKFQFTNHFDNRAQPIN